MTRDWAPKAEPPKPPACSQVELFQVRGRWRDPGIKTLVWGWQVYSQQLLLFSFSLSFYIYTFFAFFFNLRETWIYSFTSVQTKQKHRVESESLPLPSPPLPPPHPPPPPPRLCKGNHCQQFSICHFGCIYIETWACTNVYGLFFFFFSKWDHDVHIILQFAFFP